VLQLAEQVVEKNQGTPVLYFSLEMPADSLTAKVISRHSFMNAALKTRIKVEDMLNPEKAKGLTSSAKSKLRSIIMDMAKSTASGKNFYIIDRTSFKKKFKDKQGNSMPFSAKAIAKVVSAFIEEHKTEEQDFRPLVVVDYLQILEQELSEEIKDMKGSSNTGTEKKKVDDSLTQFLDLIHKENIPLILISSLNRGSYNRPIQMDSFKETGDIEYSAEILLGLQLVACHKKESEWNLNDEQKKSPRNVEITVLKQRYGGSGDLIPFLFYPGYSCFKEKLAPRTAAEPSSKAKGGGLTEEEQNEEIYYINNTKICNEIRKGIPNGDCAVFGKKDESVTTRYSLKDKNNNVLIALTAYECNVADAIYTLYKAKKRRKETEFTLEEVLRVLSGDPGQTVTGQKRDKLIKTIDKLQNTAIEINYAEEKRKRQEDRREGGSPSFGEESPILEGEFLSVQKNGDKYRFDQNKSLSKIMPLYAYGEWTRQMISFPSCRLSVYDGDKKLSDTEENINLKRFLIRRVEVAGYGKNPNAAERKNMGRISFQKDKNLLTEVKLNYRSKDGAKDMTKAVWNKKVRNLYKATIIILEYYKQTGYIKDYKEKPARSKENPVGSIELDI